MSQIFDHSGMELGSKLERAPLSSECGLTFTPQNDGGHPLQHTCLNRGLDSQAPPHHACVDLSWGFEFIMGIMFSCNTPSIVPSCFRGKCSKPHMYPIFQFAFSDRCPVWCAVSLNEKHAGDQGKVRARGADVSFLGPGKLAEFLTSRRFNRVILIGSSVQPHTYICLPNLPHEPNVNAIHFFNHPPPPIGKKNSVMLYYTAWHIHALILTCFLANTWFSWMNGYNGDQESWHGESPLFPLCEHVSRALRSDHFRWRTPYISMQTPFIFLRAIFNQIIQLFNITKWNPS